MSLKRPKKLRVVEDLTQRAPSKKKEIAYSGCNSRDIYTQELILAGLVY